MIFKRKADLNTFIFSNKDRNIATTRDQDFLLACHHYLPPSHDQKLFPTSQINQRPKIKKVETSWGVLRWLFPTGSMGWYIGPDSSTGVVKFRYGRGKREKDEERDKKDKEGVRGIVGEACEHKPWINVKGITSKSYGGCISSLQRHWKLGTKITLQTLTITPKTIWE